MKCRTLSLCFALCLCTGDCSDDDSLLIQVARKDASMSPSPPCDEKDDENLHAPLQCPGACSGSWSGACLGSGDFAIPTTNYQPCFRPNIAYCVREDKPTFNWIIGVVEETKLNLEFVAAYALDTASKYNDEPTWQLIPSSTWQFGSNAPQNMSSSACSSWTQQPYPGGAAHWTHGFTPYGPEVKSAGPPGMMYALKAKGKINTRWTWYVLNQVTLNVGAYCSTNPACTQEGAQGNCWSQGGYEIDVVEGTGLDYIGYADGVACLNTQNPDPQFNFGEQSCMQGEGDTGSGGSKQQRLFTEDDLQSEEWDSPLLVVVIDKKGATLYLNPEFDGPAPLLPDVSAAGLSMAIRPQKAQKIWFTPVKDAGQHMWFMDTNQLQAQSAHWGCGSSLFKSGAGSTADSASPSGVAR